MNNILNTLVKANNKKYFFNFSMSAIMKLEKEEGVTFEEMMGDVASVKEGQVKSLAPLFWIIKAGLDRGMRKTHTDDEIYDFMDDLQIEYGFEKSIEVMTEIIEKSMNSENAKRQQEYYMKTQANKPQQKNFKKKMR